MFCTLNVIDTEGLGQDLYSREDKEKISISYELSGYVHRLTVCTACHLCLSWCLWLSKCSLWEQIISFKSSSLWYGKSLTTLGDLL